MKRILLVLCVAILASCATKKKAMQKCDSYSCVKCEHKESATCDHKNKTK